METPRGRLERLPSAADAFVAVAVSMIETPWLVNGGHGASIRHHNCQLGAAAAEVHAGAGRQRAAAVFNRFPVRHYLPEPDGVDAAEVIPKRPVVESSWSQFTSECQRFGHPPRLDQ
jgi:hypothetical protein